jgi:hypothetical protein
MTFQPQMHARKVEFRVMGRITISRYRNVGFLSMVS